MQEALETTEILGPNPDPMHLLQELDALDTDQKKFNHLRSIFLKDADVNEYLRFLNTDAETGLTISQLSRLKAVLKDFKVYLGNYLEQTARRIVMFDKKLKNIIEEFARPKLTPENAEKIGHIRKRVAQAIRIAEMARGIKGKSLREVTRNGVPSVIGGKKELSPRHKEKLLAALKARFEENMNRHEGIKWSHALAKLEANPKKLWSLNEMERTGGEPDVIEFEKKTGKYIFVDCSEESPSGRRSLSYDRDGEENARDHGFGPRGNAVDMAKAMGIAILTEKRYRELQKLGSFDRGTWSWIRTSRKRRSFGCALSGVCIKGNCEVFVAGGSEPTLGRAFRGLLKV